MPNALHPSDRNRDGAFYPNRLLLARGLMGSGAGLAIWITTLLPGGPDEGGVVRGMIALAAMTLPVVALGAYGVMRPRIALAWALGAIGVVILAGLGRSEWLEAEFLPPIPDGPVLPLTCLALIIGHVLVRAREPGNAPFPGWPDIFATAWSEGVRTGLSAALAAALLAVTALAGSLFEMVGISAVGQFLSRPGVLWPAAGLAFGLGVHFTAERADLAQGARTLGLGMLSWLLPVMTALVATFLAALPFTGLEPLWNTGAAGSLLMAAGAVLIVLMNAAVQDETDARKIALPLRLSARLAGLLLAPLVSIAAFGILVRIEQHGLSPDRIFALACAVTLSVFAVGYGAAALSRGAWITVLGRTNLAGVGCALLTLITILSPPGDPVRLSVNDQMHRLMSGKTSPQEFDFAFLRDETGPEGQRAFSRLLADAADPAIMAAARRAADDAFATGTAGSGAAGAAAITTVGAAPAPADFLASKALRECRSKTPCWIAAVDLDQDGAPEVLLQRDEMLDVWKFSDGGWRELGQMVSACPGDWSSFRAGDIQIAPIAAPTPDLVTGNTRLRLIPSAEACPG